MLVYGQNCKTKSYFMSKNLSSTTFAKTSEINSKWLIVDARDQVLGRLASRIAIILRGKHKACFTPHINCGDKVIVINTSRVKLTGKKLQQKTYYRHTGFPGGIKERKAIDVISGKRPEMILYLAVKRMLPKESPLARLQLKSLYIYPDAVHPHNAQSPILIKLINSQV